MNTSQGALYFGAGIDLNQWRRDVDSMRRDILGLGQDVRRESSNMDSAFKNISIGIAGYFSVGAIKSFVMELINVRGEFQKTEIAFSTMLGNVGEAKALMGDMVDLAAKTPFSLQDVSSGAKQLLAFQVPANEVVDTLTRMGNIAAGLSIPLSRINLVYGQVKAKGKLAGDDLRQFTEAGIPMVAELAKKFNKTTAEISAMVSAGKIGFKDVQDVLFSMTNEGGMFFNLMEKQSKSLSGQIANLGDAWDQMLNTIGEGQEGILSDGIQGLVYLVEHYQEVGKALLTLIEIYGAYKTALIVTNLLQSGIAAPAIVQGFANLIKIIRGATVAQEALNTASLKNPYVLVATLIAALIAVTYNYRQEIGELLGIIEKATVAQKIQDQVMKQYNDNFGKGVVDTRAAIQQLIYVIKSEYSSLKQREEAYKKLIAIDATFVGTLDNQFRATNRLSLAFENLIKNLQKYAMAQAEVAVRAEKFKEFAEAEMNVGITQVKLDDAKAKIEQLTKLFNAGKISQEEYFKGLERTQGSELNKQLIDQKENLKGITKEKEYIQKLDQKEISNLLKGNEILKAQLRGGKVQGKLLSAQGKKELQAQLNNNENILKLRFGVEPEIKVTPAAVKGWAQGIKDQISALEEELNAPTTGQARYYEIQKKIDALNELLNPKKATKNNKQLAELFPDDSIKDLERKSQLIADALQTVQNGIVKLRKIDKYGNDKDKKGNALLTGEEVPVEEAVNRQKKINEALAAKRKEIEVRSFEEEITETKRQIEVRDKLLRSGYTKDTVDNMFPAVKDKTFLQYLNDTSSALEKLEGKEPADKLIKLQNVLTDYTGSETFLENVNKQIESLKSQFIGNELIDKLEKFKKANLEGTTGDDKNAKNIAIAKAQEEELDRQKAAYQNLLEENKAFAEKKIQIEKETKEALNKINSDEKLTPEKKKQTSESVDRKSKEEVSQLAVDELTKSKAWMTLYGGIEELTAYQMDVLLKELEAKKGTLEKVLTTVDFKILLKNFKEVKQQINEENPFLGLFNSVQQLFSAFTTGAESAGETAVENFTKATGAVKGTLKSTQGIVDTLAPAREYMSDAANAAIDIIEQVTTVGIVMMEAIDATSKAVKAVMNKASWGNWITAIISIIYTVIKAVVSLFTWMSKIHDKKLQKEIKEHQSAVDGLKLAYDDLAQSIKKALGDDTRKLQLEQIKNIQKQNEELAKIREAEDKKKKTDKDKLAQYDKDIADNKAKIAEMQAEIINNILQTDAHDAAAKLGDALVEAFSRGEDASKSMMDAANSMIQDIVKNALKLRLEKQIQPLLDSLLGQMGFDKNGNGDFKNLSKDQREAFKAQMASIGSQQQSFLDAYKEIFADASNGAQGLKGEIKGMTEKTAGALEGQFNAVRINIVAVLKIMQGNQIVSNAQTTLLSQIEINTRRLHNMDKTLAEMNSKMKNNLAGIP